MERVTGIEPAEPQIKPKRDKGDNNDGRQVDAFNLKTLTLSLFCWQLFGYLITR